MDPKPPKRPTLEGLERRWADRWARSGVYRFDRTRPRVEVFSIDTPPPPVRGPPVPGPGGAGGVLPDGLGRQRPADRAPGAAALRGPLRPVATLQAGLRAARVAVPPADPRLPAELRRALQPADHGGRAGLRGHLPPPGAVGGLVADLCHHRRAGPAGLPAGVPAPAGQGPGLPGR